MKKLIFIPLFIVFLFILNLIHIKGEPNKVLAAGYPTVTKLIVTDIKKNRVFDLLKGEIPHVWHGAGNLQIVIGIQNDAQQRKVYWICHDGRGHIWCEGNKVFGSNEYFEVTCLSDMPDMSLVWTGFPELQTWIWLEVGTWGQNPSWENRYELYQGDVPIIVSATEGGTTDPSPGIYYGDRPWISGRTMKYPCDPNQSTYTFKAIVTEEGYKFKYWTLNGYVRPEGDVTTLCTCRLGVYGLYYELKAVFEVPSEELPPPPPSEEGPPSIGGGIHFGSPFELKCEDLPCIIEAIINFIFYVGIALLPLIIIIGGIMYATSGGDYERVSNAKRIIFWAVVGLIIILLAKAIISVIRSVLGGG